MFTICQHFNTIDVEVCYTRIGKVVERNNRSGSYKFNGCSVQHYSLVASLSQPDHQVILSSLNKCLNEPLWKPRVNIIFVLSNFNLMILKRALTRGRSNDAYSRVS